MVRSMRYLARAFVLLALIMILAGCASPAWYPQAVSGHMEIMRQREDIASILNSGTADPELASELGLSVKIRHFAVSDLSLPDNGSYSEYVRTGRDAVTWNVVAAPEFSLQPKRWCFIVSGCVPYRGYFGLAGAEKLAARLSARGYDTAVSPAIAYSTLGWFDDPLLDTMLRYSDEQLAAFIFHELAHQKLYVRGDAAFNEAYASFVEEQGVRLWLQSSGRSDRLPAWLEREQAGIEYSALLQQTRKQLRVLYASDRTDEQKRAGKSAVIRRMQDEYRALVNSQWGGISYFESTLSREMNNARLALVNSYRGGACAFNQLFSLSKNNMARFHQLAGEKAALPKKQRRAWLLQSCGVIASGSDL